MSTKSVEIVDFPTGWDDVQQQGDIGARHRPREVETLREAVPHFVQAVRLVGREYHRPWPGGSREMWLRLDPGSITGRRIRVR